LTIRLCGLRQLSLPKLSLSELLQVVNATPLGTVKTAHGVARRLQEAADVEPVVAAELAFLTRALKAPALRESAARLADRARAESWTHEEFLVACLQREVSARESHGGEVRLQRWRAQFIGKTVASPLRVGDDIANHSGATHSCQHVTDGVRRIVAVLDSFRQAGALP
jgi:hypothetical protein